MTEQHNSGAKMSMLYTQSEVSYTTLSQQPAQACANCRWFSANPDGWCRIVAAHPKDLLPTGWCSEWRAMPEEPTDSIIDDLLAATEGDDMEDERAYKPDDDKEDDEEEETTPDEPRKKPRKDVLATVVDTAKSWFGATDDTLQTGIKVSGDRWLAVWSNNFQDREGELFTEKAIDDYVKRVDMHLVPPPELWFWHTPGTKSGQATWVGRHGHFLLAMGEFDDDDKGRALKAHITRNPKKLRMSHGFAYSKDHFDGTHYHRFNTFEITVLPAGKEANLYTTMQGVKQMTLDESKKRDIVAVFGESILEELDKAGKAIADMGTAYKDYSPVTEITDDQPTDNKEAIAFKALLPDLIEGQTEVVEVATAAIKAVKELREQITAQNEQIAAMKEQLDATPRRASQAKETEIDSDALSDKVRETMTIRDPFWGTEVIED